MNTRKNYCSFAGLLFLGLILILFFGCSKIDLNSPTNQQKTFNVEDAKEWWFGTFKKSQRFKYFDQQSTFLTIKSNQPESILKKLTPETRYPSWKSATMHNVGKNIFIQLDLVQAYTSIPIPLKVGENEADRKRIANSTVQKLLLVKLANGQIVERVVTIIPSLDYLKKHNFFNPLKNILVIPDDFSGIVLVRDWNEINKAAWLYNNGKRRVLELRKIKIEEQNAIVRNYMPCEPYWGITNYERWCIDVHMGNADEPSGYCDDPNNWHEHIEYGYIYPDGDCGETGDPCDYLTYEECQCQTFGLGCEGGGGDGDPPPPPEPDPCEDAQPAANATTALSQDPKFSIGKSAIEGQNPSFEHTVTFGKDANDKVTVSPVNVGTQQSDGEVDPNWPGAFADLHNHPNNLPPSAADMYGLIAINGNHNGYDTRMVITQDGSIYALVVTDLAKANSFKKIHPPVDNGFGPDFSDQIYNIFDLVKNQFYIQGSSVLIAEERAMAYVLDFYNTGVILLKQGSNGAFKRLITNSNTLNGNVTYTENNCQ